MAAGFSVTVDIRQAAALLKRWQAPELHRRLRAGLTEAALYVERQVVRRTPKKTGALAASIHGRTIGPLSAEVTTSLHYGPHVEYGTRAHTIVPRSGRFLAFDTSGGRVFARRVRHPGTKGRHMFRDAAQASQGPVAGIITRRLAA
jgi:hypothetical protein